MAELRALFRPPRSTLAVLQAAAALLGRDDADYATWPRAARAISAPLLEDLAAYDATQVREPQGSLRVPTPCMQGCVV